MYSVLNAGISMVCQEKAPLVSIAQDRRSLRRYYEALYDKELQGLRASIGRYGARGDRYPDLNKGPWREELAHAGV